MAEVTHSIWYKLLKSRLMDYELHPYTKERSKEEVKKRAIDLSITTEEENELLALVDAHGHDILPEDVESRLTSLEARTEDTELIIADMMVGGMA